MKITKIKQIKSKNSQQDLGKLTKEILGISCSNLIKPCEMLLQQKEKIKQIASIQHELRKKFIKNNACYQMDRLNLSILSLCKNEIFTFCNMIIVDKQYMQDPMTAKCILENRQIDLELINDQFEYYKNSIDVKILLDFFNLHLYYIEKSKQYDQVQKQGQFINFIIQHNQTWNPFITVDFDVISCYCQLQQDDKKNLLNDLIYKLLQSYEEFYQLFITPIIDMDALEPVLAEKLDEFKKLIPNVDFALDSIKSKFHLLRQNFEKYYSNQIKSQGGAMMFLTEFISDVYANMKEEDSIMSKTKGKKSNYKLISQFITLLSSMKKIMSQSVPIQQQESDNINSFMSGITQKLEDIRDSIKQEEEDEIIEEDETEEDDQEEKKSNEKDDIDLNIILKQNLSENEKKEIQKHYGDNIQQFFDDIQKEKIYLHNETIYGKESLCKCCGKINEEGFTCVHCKCTVKLGEICHCLQKKKTWFKQGCKKESKRLQISSEI